MVLQAMVVGCLLLVLLQEAAVVMMMRCLQIQVVVLLVC
jgi:hypothetical protein